MHGSNMHTYKDTSRDKSHVPVVHDEIARTVKLARCNLGSKYTPETADSAKEEHGECASIYIVSTCIKKFVYSPM